MNINLKFGLKKKQKKEISELFEKLINKYQKMSETATHEWTANYMSGVADGINHCFKIINETPDDYLDGVE